MINKFLQYSLKHQRPIKVLLMPGFKPQSFNLTVQEITQESISYLSAKNKTKTKELLIDDVLAASYARGDDGDTLRNKESEPRQHDK
ncbi:MAG: hypothetical protein GX781_04105 [Clostridiales bacterium]|nr:hypothetical protein [Clostridiales bacterium]